MPKNTNRSTLTEVRMYHHRDIDKVMVRLLYEKVDESEPTPRIRRLSLATDDKRVQEISSAVFRATNVDKVAKMRPWCGGMVGWEATLMRAPD